MRVDIKRLGILGTVITALCCFTPILAGLLAITGLSWLIGYLDFILFPVLFIFLGITVYALWCDGYFQPKKNKTQSVKETTNDNRI